MQTPKRFEHSTALRVNIKNNYSDFAVGLKSQIITVQLENLRAAAVTQNVMKLTQKKAARHLELSRIQFTEEALRVIMTLDEEQFIKLVQVMKVFDKAYENPKAMKLTSLDGRRLSQGQSASLLQSVHVRKEGLSCHCR